MNFSKKFRALRRRIHDLHAQGHLKLEQVTSLDRIIDAMERAARVRNNRGVRQATGQFARAFLEFLDDMTR